MFTLTRPNHIDTGTAVHRLTETRTRDLTESRRRLSDALTTAHTFSDPDLTDDANARRRADMARAAREQAAAGLRREVDGTADAGNALRSAVAARIADQQAAPLPTA
jgi:hypothetical protein